jgi:hypothetical protein
MGCVWRIYEIFLLGGFIINYKHQFACNIVPRKSNDMRMIDARCQFALNAVCVAVRVFQSELN